MKTRDADAAAAHLSAAIRRFTAADDRCRAALACARLGDLSPTRSGTSPRPECRFSRNPPHRRRATVHRAALGGGGRARVRRGRPCRAARSGRAGSRPRRAVGRRNLETKVLADAGLRPRRRRRSGRSSDRHPRRSAGRAVMDAPTRLHPMSMFSRRTRRCRAWGSFPSTPTCCWPRSRCSSTPGWGPTATGSSTPCRRSSTQGAAVGLADPRRRRPHRQHPARVRPGAAGPPGHPRLQRPPNGFVVASAARAGARHPGG